MWTAADEVFRRALELGGTLTGEHGVGVLKRRWLSLELGEDSMQLHRSIKAAFDPLGILNRVRVSDSRVVLHSIYVKTGSGY